MRCPSLGCGDTNHHIWIAASCSLLFFLWKEDEIKVLWLMYYLNYLLVLIIYLSFLFLWKGFIWRAKLGCGWGRVI